MYNIGYGIGVNDEGRPCIDLPEDYEHRPEDKFFAIEIARYVLQEVYRRRSAELDAATGEIMETTINFLGQIGDEMSEIIYNDLRGNGQEEILKDTRYHIIVDDIQERDALPEKHILAFDKLYDRELGLKVYVLEDAKIYELVNGIKNENWKIIHG